MKNILKWIVPKFLRDKAIPYRTQLRNFQILAFEYGQWKTIKNWECIDKEGKPIPWFTYPAIEYISHLDLSEYSVFEYGSGFSTLFWLEKVKEIVSVEHDKDWFEKIFEKVKGLDKIKYLLYENQEEYVNSLIQQNKRFDIYVIDGRWRGECAKVVVNHIQKYGGGIVIFDNSDWYPNTIEYLRKNLKWIEVDFHGFGPINGYTWTTTLFINNSINLEYKSNLTSAFSVKQIVEADLI